MKKTYQNPQIEIVNVQTAQMIAASTEMYGKNATGAAMSRRHESVWDDEEDEGF